VYDAAVEAITETDKAVGTIYKAAEKNGYVLLITADHGNAEQVRYSVRSCCFYYFAFRWNSLTLRRSLMIPFSASSFLGSDPLPAAI
jgi:arylsulfatase A-like enzyme